MGPEPDAGAPDAETPDAGFDTGPKGVDAGPLPFDQGPPPVDMPPPVDVPAPPVDMPLPVDRGQVVEDRGVTPTDTGPVTGSGAYFDPCTAGAQCASGDCIVLPGAAEGFCTRSCVATTGTGCGPGMLCAFGAGGSTTGRCLPEDTGAPCRVSANSCYRFCYSGNNAGTGHCTRECGTARDCPAGFACQPVNGPNGPTRICTEVERPCAASTECASGLCQGYGGCTALCNTASDCPSRMIIDLNGQLVRLPPYQCLTSGGIRRCVPPLQQLDGDILGTDPQGATCRTTANGPLCHSGVCDSDENVCVQGCTPNGGCPAGFACRTWLPDGPTGQVYLVCRPNGNQPPGARCNAGSQCVSGLCLGEGVDGYCTRFCDNNDCPSAMRCTAAGSAIDGTPLRLCQR